MSDGRKQEWNGRMSYPRLIFFLRSWLSSLEMNLQEGAKCFVGFIHGGQIGTNKISKLN